MSHYQLMIAISYLEWIRWVATGRLRCNGRIVAVNGFDDQLGFNALLDRAPDLNFEDEQGFLIAALRPDALQAIHPFQAGSGLESVRVPISSVAAFYPVTERGKRLLEADAARAAVRLEEPLLANLWARWQSLKREDAEQHRSEMLCSVLGLPTPSLDRIPPPVLDLLMGRTVPSTADKAAQLRGSSAYAWALTFGIFGDMVGEDTKKALSKQWGLGDLLRNLERGYPIGRPVTGSEAVKVTKEMSRHLLESSGWEISVLLMAVVLHYRHLLTSDRPVSLDSLLTDLVELGSNGGVELASMAASAIAPCMDDVAVSTLMYQASPASFLAMKPTKLHASIDVACQIEQRRAAQALKDSVDPIDIEKSQSTEYRLPDESSEDTPSHSESISLVSDAMEGSAPTPTTQADTALVLELTSNEKPEDSVPLAINYSNLADALSEDSSAHEISRNA
jgi:hypothetical protein